MIYDLDRDAAWPSNQHYDVCIAGGGVAGITIAKRLAEQGRRVLLLEGGGLNYADRSQAIYQGENIGREYFDLDTARMRLLGGTSQHWGGWCRPLDSYDYLAHDYLEESGWPISTSDLAPFLPQAYEILEIDEFPEDQKLPGADGDLKEIFFRWSPPVRFNQKYRVFLESSEAIDVYLNANLVGMPIEVDTGRIAGFRFRGYGNSHPLHEAVADCYVLALGGIENARLLLHMTAAAPVLGNRHDQIGRFFMEHLHHVVAYYLTTQQSPFGKDLRFLAATPTFMRREGVANCVIRVEPLIDTSSWSWTKWASYVARKGLCTSDLVADLVRTMRHMHCPPQPLNSGRLRAVAEQVPNPESRIVLSDEVDEIGLQRIDLNWQLSPVDKKTMRAIAVSAGKYFARSEAGRVKILDWVLAEDDIVPGISEGEETAGYHHMGTTRMGYSERDGVVDGDCRVFGLSNLYIAGSSVFRTSGHANPTLTIVQLALRLADHLARASA